MSTPSGLHNDLQPLAWLAGTWETKNGLCQYPTMKDFQYHEELEFICIGQPMFNYTSKAVHPEKGTPLHQERGFLRVKPGTKELAFMVSHNFGLTSLEEGQFDESTHVIDLTSVSISRMSFAKPPAVLRFKRTIKLLDQNTLQVTVYMETENTELCKHLEATYSRKV
ncbi:peroxynitrite isomerase THAP4-like [Aricia agestis]|uniref:peroxynitrite isomerase THAP4-like n=1 Tax=Aricia agestis TaxID=91739 RepID=UPI001C20470E|nr:peroxynitrite isomerase THAP4-like [Aricia agestis]